MERFDLLYFVEWVYGYLYAICSALFFYFLLALIHAYFLSAVPFASSLFSPVHNEFSPHRIILNG
jgi:hypothetical protein